MAKATADVITKVENVVLHLDSDEAQTLLDILCCVGGDKSSRRVFASEIRSALMYAGVRPSAWQDIHETYNAIYFK